MIAVECREKEKRHVYGGGGGGEEEERKGLDKGG